MTRCSILPYNIVEFQKVQPIFTTTHVRFTTTWCCVAGSALAPSIEKISRHVGNQIAAILGNTAFCAVLGHLMQFKGTSNLSCAGHVEIPTSPVDNKFVC